MSRSLRREFPGTLHHVTSRADRREPIVEGDADRLAWPTALADAPARFDAAAYAYCMMDNHDQVALPTHRPSLPRLLRHLNGGHAQTAISAAAGLSVSRVSQPIAQREAQGANAGWVRRLRYQSGVVKNRWTCPRSA